jgi:Rieske Fe-S protein
VLTGAVGAVGAGAIGLSAACAEDDGSRAVDPAEPVTVPTGNVPVGGAVIAGGAVVSQPTAGEFKAFSAVCTHQGCLVSRVNGDTVECTCHFSEFSAVDGTVRRGPAQRALTPRTVTVEGGSLTVA